MANVFIGIGGTGARVLEAFVHLSAIGLGPDRLRVLLVDPDSGNGNLNRTKQTLSNYMACRRETGLGVNTDIFRTEYTWSQEGRNDRLIWQPFDPARANRLGDYFTYTDLKARRDLLGDLCDLMYTQEELALTWDQGFRGRPSIGAPVMAAGIRGNLNNLPWRDIVADLSAACTAGEPAKVFVVGSVFGATGAAGFPAVAKVLRNYAREQAWNNQDKLMFGGAPLLPYFGYRVPPETEQDTTLVFARPRNFAVNTAAALRYYASSWGAATPYDAVYLLGDKNLDETGRNFALGGTDQANPPHFIEMYAALAACHFLTEWSPSSPRRLHQYMVARKTEDIINRYDVPGKGFYNQLLTFTTFAFAFLGFYDKLLDFELERYRALLPWYLDKFPSRGELNQESVQGGRTWLREYLLSYLHWLRWIEKGPYEIRLINKAALYVTQKDEEINFRNLLENDQFRCLRYLCKSDPEDNYSPKYRYGYDALWEELCNVSSERKREDEVVQISTAIGRFAYLLHKACSRFTKANYGLTG